MAEPVAISSDPGVSADTPAAAAACSYRQMLGSSTVLGASTLLAVLIGMVRTKLLATLLGPSGYGLMGAYLVIVEFAKTVAQVGLSTSGVRQIAAAVGSGDDARIGLTVVVLRRTSVVCGVAGGLALAALAPQVAALTFGDGRNAGGVAVLGLAVALSVVASGQAALLQGLRRIGDLSRLTVIGGLAGTIAGVPLVWRFGADGVAPTVVAIAAATLLASWHYARRVDVGRPRNQPPGALTQEAVALLGLGLVFMGSGLLTVGAAWAVRIIVLRHDGLAAAGLYQAAWMVGGVYTGFVLQALGTDFYPRLVAAMRDRSAANRLVDEQTRIGLLIALPGVLATLTLAPLAVHVLYSAQFEAAADVLRWICLGMALRVLSWPLGFILIAQNQKRLYLAIEIAWTVVNLALTALLVERWGVVGAGVAFFASYVFHLALLVPLVRRTSGFRWSRATAVRVLAGGAMVAAVYAGFVLLPAHVALWCGLAATTLAAYASAREIVTLVAPERLPRIARWTLRLGESR